MGEINKYKISEDLNLEEDFIKNIRLFFIFKVYSSEVYSYKTNVVIITNGDKAYAYGYNNDEILGFSNTNEVELTPNENLSNKQVIDLKNSYYHTIARTNYGKVYSWGWNEYGVLGIGRNDGKIYKPEFNKYLSDKNITDIHCGGAHSLALTTDGQVYAWGWNFYGQIGNGNIVDVSIPYHVNGFNGERVKVIACGFYHSMALTEKGNVFSWGWNNFGQVGFKKLKQNDLINAPKLIEINEIFEKISCGREHSLLLSRDREIYVLGWNKYGQLGDETIKDRSEVPLKLKNENKFIDVASHWYYDISMALSEEGIIFIWGQCGKEVIKTPIEMQFKSFTDVFAYYEQITYKTIYCFDNCCSAKTSN